MLAAAMVVPETQRRHPSGFEQTREAECGILAKAWLGVKDFDMLRAVWFSWQETVTFNLFASPCCGIFVLLTLGYNSVKGKIHCCRDTTLKREFFFIFKLLLYLSGRICLVEDVYLYTDDIAEGICWKQHDYLKDHF